MVIDKVLDKSETEPETNESKEELKYSQKYKDCVLTIPDDLDEKEENDLCRQAVFKRSAHNI